jgi:hypothetical protein
LIFIAGLAEDSWLGLAAVTAQRWVSVSFHAYQDHFIMYSNYLAASDKTVHQTITLFKEIK